MYSRAASRVIAGIPLGHRLKRDLQLLSLSCLSHRIEGSPQLIPARYASSSPIGEAYKSQIPKLPTKLPLPVPDFSARSISQEDLDTYLLPMYSKGWRVTYRSEFKGNKQYRIPRLMRIFMFRDVPSAFSFFDEIGQLSKNEKLPINIGVDGTVVYFYSNTGRSVTRGDIRISVLAHNVFNDVYLADQRGIQPYFRGPTSARSRPAFVEVLNMPHRDVVKPERPTCEPTEAHSIPSLPPSSSSPITDTDVTQYLRPLYSRRWRISYHHKTDPQSESIPKHKFYFARLGKAFTFDDPYTALEFASAAWKKAENTTLTVNVDGNAVYIYTNSKFADNNSDQPYGLTHDDIRLAIRVESFFSDEYSSKSVQDLSKIYRWSQPIKMAHLKANIERYTSLHRKGQKSNFIARVRRETETSSETQQDLHTI